MTYNPYPTGKVDMIGKRAYIMVIPEREGHLPREGFGIFASATAHACLRKQQGPPQHQDDRG